VFAGDRDAIARWNVLLRIVEERVRALAAFRADVLAGGFPNDSEVGRIDPLELARFVESLGEEVTRQPPGR
jgi:hypothetical protein